MSLRKATRSPEDPSVAYLVGKLTQCPKCNKKAFRITMAYLSAVMDGHVSLHYECTTQGCHAMDWKRIPMPEVCNGADEKLV